MFYFLIQPIRVYPYFYKNREDLYHLLPDNFINNAYIYIWMEQKLLKIDDFTKFPNEHIYIYVNNKNDSKILEALIICSECSKFDQLLKISIRMFKPSNADSYSIFIAKYICGNDDHHILIDSIWPLFRNLYQHNSGILYYYLLNYDQYIKAVKIIEKFIFPRIFQKLLKKVEDLNYEKLI